MRRVSFFLLLSFIFISGASGQSKVRKQLQQSTKEQLKLYKLQTQKSIDSAKRIEKHKQDSIQKKNNPDTIPFQKAFRIGFDISKPVNSKLNTTLKGLEFSIDYHYKLRYFYVAEIGYESVKYDVPGYYNYNSSGEYLKLGFDYGIFKVTRRNDNNIVFTGLRIAGSLVNFEANNIQIIEPYFGNLNSPNIKSNAKAFWFELVFGTKVELIHHLFLGWSVRLSSRLNNLTNNENYPVRVPGFGNSLSAQNFNYTYSVFYSF